MLLVIIHVLIAISSIAYTGYTFLFPTKTKFKISYAFVAATLTTGTYLVMMKPAHMVSACMTGIVYLAFVTVGLVAAHQRLVASESK